MTQTLAIIPLLTKPIATLCTGNPDRIRDVDEVSADISEQQKSSALENDYTLLLGEVDVHPEMKVHHAVGVEAFQGCGQHSLPCQKIFFYPVVDLV